MFYWIVLGQRLVIYILTVHSFRLFPGSPSILQSISLLNILSCENLPLSTIFPPPRQFLLVSACQAISTLPKFWTITSLYFLATIMPSATLLSLLKLYL